MDSVYDDQRHFRQPLSNVADLKAAIIQAFSTVTADMRQKAVLEYRRRLQKCYANGGRHVEVEVVNKF